MHHDEGIGVGLPHFCAPQFNNGIRHNFTTNHAHWYSDCLKVIIGVRVHGLIFGPMAVTQIFLMHTPKCLQTHSLPCCMLVFEVSNPMQSTPRIPF